MKYKLNVIVENPTTFDRIENVISILISPKLCRFFPITKISTFSTYSKYYRITLLAEEADQGTFEGKHF